MFLATLLTGGAVLLLAVRGMEGDGPPGRFRLRTSAVNEGGRSLDLQGSMVRAGEFKGFSMPAWRRDARIGGVEYVLKAELRARRLVPAEGACELEGPDLLYLAEPGEMKMKVVQPMEVRVSSELGLVKEGKTADGQELDASFRERVVVRLKRADLPPIRLDTEALRVQLTDRKKRAETTKLVTIRSEDGNLEARGTGFLADQESGLLVFERDVRLRVKDLSELSVGRRKDGGPGPSAATRVAEGLIRPLIVTSAGRMEVRSAEPATPGAAGGARIVFPEPVTITSDPDLRLDVDSLDLELEGAPGATSESPRPLVRSGRAPRPRIARGPMRGEAKDAVLSTTPAGQLKVVLTGSPWFAEPLLGGAPPRGPEGEHRLTATAERAMELVVSMDAQRPTDPLVRLLGNAVVRGFGIGPFEGLATLRADEVETLLRPAPPGAKSQYDLVTLRAQGSVLVESESGTMRAPALELVRDQPLPGAARFTAGPGITLTIPPSALKMGLTGLPGAPAGRGPQAPSGPVVITAASLEAVAEEASGRTRLVLTGRPALRQEAYELDADVVELELAKEATEAAGPTDQGRSKTVLRGAVARGNVLFRGPDGFEGVGDRVTIFADHHAELEGRPALLKLPATGRPGAPPLEVRGARLEAWPGAKNAKDATDRVAAEGEVDALIPAELLDSGNLSGLFPGAPQARPAKAPRETKGASPVPPGPGRLKCERLEAGFAKTAQGRREIRSFRASGGVFLDHVAGWARGDELFYLPDEPAAGAQGASGSWTLTGAPAEAGRRAAQAGEDPAVFRSARITAFPDAKGLRAGPGGEVLCIARGNPGDGVLDLGGPSKRKTPARDKTKTKDAKPQRVRILFEGPLIGDERSVRATGNVRIRAAAPDGTETGALRGDAVTLELSEKQELAGFSAEGNVELSSAERRGWCDVLHADLGRKLYRMRGLSKKARLATGRLVDESREIVFDQATGRVTTLESATTVRGQSGK